MTCGNTSTLPHPCKSQDDFPLRKEKCDVAASLTLFLFLYFYYFWFNLSISVLYSWFRHVLYLVGITSDAQAPFIYIGYSSGNSQAHPGTEFSPDFEWSVLHILHNNFRWSLAYNVRHPILHDILQAHVDSFIIDGDISLQSRAPHFYPIFPCVSDLISCSWLPQVPEWCLAQNLV